MASPVDIMEDVIGKLRARRVTRSEAIAAIRAVADVTEVGAADLLDHPESPRARYSRACGMGTA